jgi:1-acyl-sn-glycerol-3-phosphate acyltransferase
MLSPAATEILAWSVLAFLALLLVARFVIYYRKYDLWWSQAPFHVLNLVYTRVVWRTKIIGQLPPNSIGGAVIICNHTCPIDPAFIQLAATRLPHWMVAREYSRHWAMGWIFRLLWAIPVNRSGVDTASTKAAIQFAKKGDLVGLFPEGRINDTDQLLLPGRPGAALIALKAEVPVIPCYIHGAPYDGTEWGCFFMPAKVTVHIGKPLDISCYFGLEPDKHVLEELTKLFMVEIAKLAGVPDYQPQLAGRFKPVNDERPVAAVAHSGELLSAQPPK